MREVTFIRDLILERKLVGTEDEIRQHRYGTLPHLPTGEAVISDPGETVEITTEIIPVIALRGMPRTTRDTLYVAYSRKVEELLGLPFAELSKQIQDLSTANAGLRATNSMLRTQRNAYRRATLWQRIKFLFKRWAPMIPYGLA